MRTEILQSVLWIIVLIATFSMASALFSVSENISLQDTLDSYTYGKPYMLGSWDCSDMSVKVAEFLQEDLGYDTLVCWDDKHAWVEVKHGKNNYWDVVETTDDPVRHLGNVVDTYEEQKNHKAFNSSLNYVCNKWNILYYEWDIK